MTPIRHLEETGSTNADARAAFAREGVCAPLWIIADRQTAGTGRRGRAWHHDAGHFAGSLVWPIEAEDLATPSLFSFLAGLAVVEAAEASGAEASRLSLKWPNDVLLDGRKLAGILCELVTEGDSRAVIAGIGVNLIRPPEAAAADGAIGLSDAVSEAPPAMDFCKALDGAWLMWWDHYRQDGFAAIRDAWLGRAAGLGGPLTVRRETSSHSGIFRGLDTNGALLLETAEGIQRVVAGDVFLGAGKV